MKNLKWLSTFIVSSFLLVGCGGGSETPDTAPEEPTIPDDEVHSAIFSNPAYLANWGEEGVFTAASNCQSCHEANTATMVYNTPEGIKDVSPYTQWKHSTMANALNDPFYNAFVEEETHIFPHLKGFIEDTCLSCHSPMAYTHAHQTGVSLVQNDTTSLLPDGAYTFDSAINDYHAREGVACTTCHQVQPEGLGTVPKMSGHYEIKSDTENGPADAKIFGPFQSPLAQPMLNSTQYTPEYAAHISESAMCASCHNLYTPTLNLEGQIVTIEATGKTAHFPEQTPYWEWLNSDFSNPTSGKTCQACHMPEPEDGYQTVISTRGGSLRERPDNAGVDDVDSVFAVHEFVGSNSYLLTLLKTYMTELGLGSGSGHTSQGFQDKIEATQTFLKTSANVNATASIAGSTLTVPVTITNLTGHKLPTSYPSRRMWIHLKVTDSTGSTVFESGASDENGRITLDENFTSYNCLSIEKSDSFDSIAESCYEPHHDVINNPNQIAIFEGVLGDVNQNITHVLLHARQYIKDNRIPPKGWRLANQHTNPADPAIKDDGIVGVSDTDTNYAPGKETASGSNGTDTVTYQVDIAGATPPFNVEANLYFQTIRPSFVYGMHADDEEHGITGNSYVARFKEMYEKTPPITETLATTTVNNIN